MSVAAVRTEPQPTAPASDPRQRLYRFTVDQYEQMTAAGILNVNDRVELLEGWVVEKMSRNPPHDGVLSRLTRRLSRLLSDDWVLRVQSALRLSDSEPEPDFAIARGPEHKYDTRHPKPKDVALVIEAADSSLLTDRRDKGRLYGAAKIPEFWIVNVAQKGVEVYTRPRAGRAPGYRERTDYTVGESVPLVLDGVEVGRIKVEEMLP